MQEKLEKGEAIDISRCERTPEGLYRLELFDSNKDYCNAETEEWIWSVGRNRNTNVILAAHDTRFYQNPGWECLFLR
jgi:hypothetical protein